MDEAALGSIGALAPRSKRYVGSMAVGERGYISTEAILWTTTGFYVGMDTRFSTCEVEGRPNIITRRGETDYEVEVMDSTTVLTWDDSDHPSEAAYVSVRLTWDGQPFTPGTS